MNSSSHQHIRIPTARRSLSTLRVLLVCDQHLTSEAIRVALRARPFDMIPLGQPHRRAQLKHAIRVMEDERPHVGLMVQELHDPVRVAASLRILRGVSGIPWLLLTGSAEGPGWGAGLEAGARDVLPMSIGLEALSEALAAVAHGSRVMPSEQRERVRGQWAASGIEQQGLLERLERLTPRELEVLQALAAGQAAVEIAVLGGVNIATVRSQVKSILRKLEVRSQLAAVAALQQAARPFRGVGPAVPVGS